MLKDLITGKGYKLQILENGKEDVIYTVYQGKNVLSMHLFHDTFKKDNGYQFDENYLRGRTFKVGKYMTNTGYAELISIERI